MSHSFFSPSRAPLPTFLELGEWRHHQPLNSLITFLFFLNFIENSIFIHKAESKKTFADLLHLFGYFKIANQVLK